MKSFKKLKSNKGSAGLAAIMGVGILAAGVSTALLVNNQSSTSAKRIQTQEAATAFAQNMSLMISKPAVCLNGLAGLGAGAANQGLQFENDAGNPSVFTPGLAIRTGAGGTPLGQRIRLGSAFDGGGLLLTSGVDINDLGLTLNRLYLQIPGGQPGPNFTGEIFAAFSSMSDEATLKNMKPVRVAEIAFIVDGGFNITSCSATDQTMSPEVICTNMGCVYDPAEEGQKCVCPLPSVACPNPNEYISGLNINPNTGATTADCKAMFHECLGANEFMEGFGDNKTSAYCATVVAITPSPTPAPSPTAAPTPTGVTPTPTGVTPTPTGAPIACTTGTGPNPGVWRVYPDTGPTNGGTNLIGGFSGNWTNWNFGNSGAHLIDGTSCGNLGDYCEKLIQPPLASDFYGSVVCTVGVAPTPQPLRWIQYSIATNAFFPKNPPIAFCTIAETAGTSCTVSEDQCLISSGGGPFGQTSYRECSSSCLLAGGTYNLTGGHVSQCCSNSSTETTPFLWTCD